VQKPELISRYISFLRTGKKGVFVIKKLLSVHNILFDYKLQINESCKDIIYVHAVLTFNNLKRCEQSQQMSDKS
jgi:hypothetical protein